MLSCSCALGPQRQATFEQGRHALFAKIALVAEELAGEILRELRHRCAALRNQLREREHDAMTVKRGQRPAPGIRG
jgi:hypothetical protein